MVYNDPGAPVIQNNLNLHVTNLATGKSTIGGFSEDRTDTENNVEQVVLREHPTQGLKVEVKAQKILPGSVQDFVLAWLVRPQQPVKA